MGPRGDDRGNATQGEVTARLRDVDLGAVGQLHAPTHDRLRQVSVVNGIDVAVAIAGHCIQVVRQPDVNSFAVKQRATEVLVLLGRQADAMRGVRP